MLRPLSLCAALAVFIVPLGVPGIAAADPDGAGAEGFSEGQERVRASAARVAQISRAKRPAAEATPLTIAIDELTPSTIPERGPIRVSGTVTNTDEVAWRGVNVYAFVSAEPLTSAPELAAAAESDPTSDVGERIVDEGNYATIDEILPGETQPFSFKVAQNLLEADSPGVYWFGVHALGDADGVVQDPVPLADGRARTFLPYVPPGRPGSVATSIVIPLRHSLDRAADGSMADIADWTRTLGTDGRLRSLLDFGTAAGSETVSWVIDPALIDAVRRLAAGNPPRSLAPTIEPGQEPGENGEGATPTDPAAPTAGDPGAEPTDGDPPAGEEPVQLDPETRAATEAAQAWLDTLRGTLTGGDEILLLPFGDTDVSGSARHDPDAYQLARQRTGELLAPFELPTSPVVASPSGFLSPGGLKSVEPGTAVLVTDQMFGSSPPAVADAGEHRVVVTSSGAVAGGPGPDEARSIIAMRQRLLAEAAVRFLTPRRPPLVVQLPPDWKPTTTLGFFSGLDVDWVGLTSVRQATATARVRPVPIDRLRYPASQREAELDAANFAAADQLTGAGLTLQTVLTLNDRVGVDVADEAFGSVSYSARLRPDASRAAADSSEVWIDGTLGQVRVQAPTAVTLSSSTGRFAATVSNDLGEPVTVGLEGRSDRDLSVEPAAQIDVPAKGRTTVLLNAETDENGIHDVTLLLTDVEGTPLGGTTELSIRSAQVSNVIWLFIGGGLALLFTAIAIRLVRRVRTSLRSGDAPDDAPSQAEATVSAGAGTR